MGSVRNRPNAAVTSNDMLGSVKTLVSIVVPLFVLTGTPFLSSASTLIHHPTAGYVTSIEGLDVDGTLYDATFHPGKTFNDLWSSFVPGGLFDRDPLFWGNAGLAEEAGNAILVALGDSERTSATEDRFRVPWEFHLPAAVINSTGDGRAELNVDELQTSDLWVAEYTVPINSPYVSFEASTIPVPGAFWLVSTGLLGLISVARRKAA